MAEKTAPAPQPATDHPFTEPEPATAGEAKDFTVHAEVLTVYRGTVKAGSSDEANQTIARMVQAGELDDLDVVETRTRQTNAHEVVTEQPPEKTT